MGRGVPPVKRLPSLAPLGPARRYDPDEPEPIPCESPYERRYRFDDDPALDMHIFVVAGDPSVRWVSQARWESDPEVIGRLISAENCTTCRNTQGCRHTRMVLAAEEDGLRVVRLVDLDPFPYEVSLGEGELWFDSGAPNPQPEWWISAVRGPSCPEWIGPPEYRITRAPYEDRALLVEAIVRRLSEDHRFGHTHAGGALNEQGLCSCDYPVRPCPHQDLVSHIRSTRPDLGRLIELDLRSRIGRWLDARTSGEAKPPNAARGRSYR